MKALAYVFRAMIGAAVTVIVLVFACPRETPAPEPWPQVITSTSTTFGAATTATRGGAAQDAWHKTPRPEENKPVSSKHQPLMGAAARTETSSRRGSARTDSGASADRGDTSTSGGTGSQPELGASASIAKTGTRSLHAAGAAVEVPPFQATPPTSYPRSVGSTPTSTQPYTATFHFWDRQSITMQCAGDQCWSATYDGRGRIRAIVTDDGRWWSDSPPVQVTITPAAAAPAYYVPSPTMPKRVLPGDRVWMLRDFTYILSPANPPLGKVPHGAGEVRWP